jgi:hypothetical protein
MPAKQIPAMAGRFIGCARFPADKLFRNHNNILLFKGFKMAGEIPVGYTKKSFQPIEIKGIVYHERRHDSKPDAAFKYFLKV